MITFQRIAQPQGHIQRLGGIGIARKILPADGDEIITARHHLQPVQQLEHHRTVFRMTALRLGEPFAHPHEAKYPALFIIEPHQFQHHLGGGGRGVERLVKLRL